MSTVSTSVENEAARRAGRRHRSILRSVARSPRGVIAVAFLLVVIFACVFANLIASYPPDLQHLADVRQGPSGSFLLGTDSLGRDLLSRLLYGGRSTLLGVAEAVLVFLAVGVPIGVAAGYAGGFADRLVMRAVDLMMSVPVIIIVLAVLAVFAKNTTAAMITVGVLGSAGLMRMVRGAVLSVREELYIDAARIVGLTPPQLVVRHVLPRCRGVIVVQTALFAAITLGVQTGIDFLSLGPAPPAPTWGGMVADASQALYQDAWLVIPSGLTIALTALAFGILGDVVRDSVAEQHSAHGGVRWKRREGRRSAAPDRDANVLLAVEGLTIGLAGTSGQSTAVKDISFEVAAGETVGLVGESGCGKTLAARAIIGLLAANADVTAGAIFLEGRDISCLSTRERRRLMGRRVSMISQDPMLALDPTFPVGSTLAEVVRAMDGGSRASARRRATELLTLVQIPDPEQVARCYPHQLSGGLAQRVAIAMALAGRPALLIADEPTTALDVTVQAEILDLLRALQQENGMGVLLVTHDWGVVADSCSRVVVMYAGQVAERAPVEDVFREPWHPYTRALLDSRPEEAVPGNLLPVTPRAAPPLLSNFQGCRFNDRCPLVRQECTVTDIPLQVSPGERASRCLRVSEMREGPKTSVAAESS